jgi:hypothetical protein
MEMPRRPVFAASMNMRRHGIVAAIRENVISTWVWYSVVALSQKYSSPVKEMLRLLRRTMAMGISLREQCQ